jgi:hypothetical protein
MVVLAQAPNGAPNTAAMTLAQAEAAPLSIPIMPWHTPHVPVNAAMTAAPVMLHFQVGLIVTVRTANACRQSDHVRSNQPIA